MKRRIFFHALFSLLLAARVRTEWTEEEEVVMTQVKTLHKRHLNEVSQRPSIKPSVSIKPSSSPSQSSSYPSLHPSTLPSMQPSNEPSIIPSRLHSLHPSISPSGIPSSNPSLQPSLLPSSLPSLIPSLIHSSKNPTQNPTSLLSLEPSTNPSVSEECEDIPGFGFLSINDWLLTCSWLNQSENPLVNNHRKEKYCYGGNDGDRRAADGCKKSCGLCEGATFAPTSSPTVYKSVSQRPSSRPSRLPTKNSSLFPSQTPTSLPTREHSSEPSSSPSNSVLTDYLVTFPGAISSLNSEQEEWLANDKHGPPPPGMNCNMDTDCGDNGICKFEVK